MGDLGSSELVVSDDGGVRCITMSRPEKLNCFTEAMFDDLADILIATEVDPKVACVVITGTGRAFCAGWDLAEMGVERSHDDGRRHGPVPCIDELIRFPKPLIRRFVSRRLKAHYHGSSSTLRRDRSARRQLLAPRSHRALGEHGCADELRILH